MRRAIERKRDGEALDASTWAQIIAAYTRGGIDDAQMAALAMAVVIRGIEDAEILALTAAMIASGDTIVFPPGAQPRVDKHSSGGVGDAVSLVVVPLVAACGVPVAKLSGRALGHTGGTLDKLESIAGFRTDLSVEAFIAQVDRIGCAIAAQSTRLVPADKKLYALRDRTGTIPSIGLIAASIVSKKIASGAEAIVYDVKTGRGAFMRSNADARTLAEKLVALSVHFGRRASALVTDMDEPLAAYVGSGLEVVEARDYLRGTLRDTRLDTLVRAVAGEMLATGGVADSATAIERALSDGSAAEKLVQLVEAQGGTRAALDVLAPGPSITLRATHAGFITEVDAVGVGELARDLVNAAGNLAGVRVRARVGDRVDIGDPLLDLIGGGPYERERADGLVRIGPDQGTLRPLVFATVRSSDARSMSAIK